MGYLVTLSFHQRPSFLDSLLFVFVTITTIGYGNVKPDSNIAKWLMILFVLMGTIMGTIFGEPLGHLADFVEDKLEKKFFEAFKTIDEKRKEKWKCAFALVWIAVVVCIGIIGIWFLDAKEVDRNGVNAIYFSVISLYTIGYGDFSFTASLGKLFALLWLPLGTVIVGRAASYLRAHRFVHFFSLYFMFNLVSFLFDACTDASSFSFRRWTCLVCVWKDKKTKAMIEAQSRIALGQQLESGTHVTHRMRRHNTDAATALKYITDILSSRYYDYAKGRDLEPADACSRVFSSSPQLELQVKIRLKREDLQPIVSIQLYKLVDLKRMLHVSNVGSWLCGMQISSYKWRGTYNFIANLPIERKKAGFTCSFGKHAKVVTRVAHLVSRPGF